MKTLATLLLVLLTAVGTAISQNPPEAFNYSAVARDANNNPIASSTIGIQITLRQGSPLGTVVYQENHFVNTDQFGLFNLIVGGGSIQGGSMASINWSGADFYMQVGMDINGGTNFLTMGTTQLLSVPYALHAKTAESVTGSSNQVFIQAGSNITISGTGTSVDPYIINSTSGSSGLIVSAGAGVTDIDGNSYNSVIYGNQEWMTENLRTTRYANGDLIPNITGNSQWENTTSGAWAHYANNSQNEIFYGKIYNYFSLVDVRNVCPNGWHVASEGELQNLIAYLGGDSNAGGRMKSSGTQFWSVPNNLATNESGLSALPGGERGPDGSFFGLGSDARIWYINGIQLGEAGFLHLNYLSGVATYLLNYLPSSGGSSPGASVRCVKN